MDDDVKGLEQLEAEDPKDTEEDLGTAAPVSVESNSFPQTTPATEPVFPVLTEISDNSIILQPEYQRRAFWDRKKKAALIESVYLGLPLPLLYMADAVRVDPDGDQIPVREVVDGQQRLTSLKEFYESKLRIPDDSVVEELKGKTYKELKPALQSTLKNFKLSTATIPTNAKADKFELFRRLNQQSTVLSDQELRNATYRGEYLKEIKDFAERKRDELRITAGDWRRMKDVEFVTRLLAFERKGPGAFVNKRLNLFLNQEMELRAQDDENTRRQRLKRIERALDRVVTVFGDLRFRPFRATDERPDGEWARTINRSLMEVQVYAFLDHSRYGFADAASFDQALKAVDDDIIENAKRLHLYSDRFNDTLQRGTTGKPNVEYRYARYSGMLREALVLVDNSRKRRFFSAQQKQNLWDDLDEADRLCAECGKPLSFADAEVDHKKPFAEGGETTEANGQLLHRSCNRAKGAHWEPNLE